MKGVLSPTNNIISNNNVNSTHCILRMKIKCDERSSIEANIEEIAKMRYEDGYDVRKKSLFWLKNSRDLI